MRTLFTLILMASSLRAATMIPIPFVGTNTITPVWWGTTETNATGVVPWKAWQAVNTNFATLQGEIDTLSGGLPDAATNAMLNSGRMVLTNQAWFYATNALTNVLVGSWTNYAGMSYYATSGSTIAMWSTDGTNWNQGATTLITNVPVRVAFLGGAVLSGSTAINTDCGITNIVIYGLTRPDLYGRTNQAWGQRMQVGTPVYDDDAASKAYVDTGLAGASWYSASRDVNLQGYAMNLSSTWSLLSTAGTNSDSEGFYWLGSSVLVSTQPVAVSLTNVSAALDGTKTNLVVKVPTNGLAGPPSLQLSHYIKPMKWTWMTNVSTVVGTNYQWTFPLPYSDTGYLMALVPSGNPGKLTVYDVLHLPPRTITNANSTTWGYGAGLVCVDSNYVYVAVGSNSWKRVGIAAW